MSKVEEKLKRAKYQEQKVRNVVLQNESSPSRKLVLETRNCWSPVNKIPPVLKGFSPPRQAASEMGFNPRGEIHIKPAKVGFRQQLMTNNQMSLATATDLEDKTLFSQINMSPELDQFAIQTAKISGGFSPDKLCGVLQKLDLIKPEKEEPGPATRQDLQLSRILQEKPHNRQIIQQTNLPNFKDCLNFYPVSFQYLKYEKTFVPTESLLQDYNQKTVTTVKLADGIPQRVPGNEFIINTTYTTTQQKQVSKAKKINVEQKIMQQENNAIKRSDEINKRDKIADSIAYQIQGYLYMGAANLNQNMALQLENLIIQAFQEDLELITSEQQGMAIIEDENQINQADTSKINTSLFPNDIAIRSIILLIKQNIISKLKQYTMQLINEDITKHKQSQFLTILTSISRLMCMGPSIRDAFVSNQFLLTLSTQISYIFKFTDRFAINKAYFCNPQFWINLMIIVRLNYDSCLIIMPQLIEFMKHLAQRQINILNKIENNQKRQVLRKKFTDGVLDGDCQSTDSDQDQQQINDIKLSLPYMNTSMKGLLLNSLAKHSSYTMEHDQIQQLILDKQKTELKKKVNYNQVFQYSEYDVMIFSTLLCQQLVFGGIQIIYQNKLLNAGKQNQENDVSAEKMQALNQNLQLIYQQLQQFKQLFIIFKEKQLPEFKLYNQFTENQLFLINKLKKVSPQGQYLGDEIIRMDWSWDEQLFDDVSKMLKQLFE